MSWTVKLKQFFLLLGDAAVFYFALIITLVLRYGNLSPEVIELHFWPLTIILAVWLMIFYIGGLYDPHSLKNTPDFFKLFFTLIFTCGALAVILFYLIPAFGITPRVNLFILLIFFSLILYIWRITYNGFLTAGRPINKILLVGYNKTTEELTSHLAVNPQLGYEIKFWMKEGLQDKEFEHLSQIILTNNINLIVVPAHIKKNSKAARLIYKNMVLGIEVMDLAELYEKVFLKVPIAELEEVWFLENLAKSHKIYEFFKRPMEIIAATILAIIFLPFIAVISLLTGLTSRGPIIYTQKRCGRGEMEFIIYKFRTMMADAEKNGPQFANPNGKDKRSTPFGGLLRRTHLDEVPQLFNIFRGELSLVGPRPERPEFVAQLKKDVPFYELRHLVRPGITGWAQINYRYGASVEDTYEKLQYDLYYLKNRSITLDAIILIKTLRLFFVMLK